MRNFHGSEVVVSVRKVDIIKKENLKKLAMILVSIIAINVLSATLIETQYSCHEDFTLTEDNKCTSEPTYDDSTGNMIVEITNSTKFSIHPFIVLSTVVTFLLIVIKSSWFKIGETQYHKTVLSTKWEHDQYTRKEDDWKQK